MRWPWILLAGLGFAWLVYANSIGAWPLIPLDVSVFWGGGVLALSGDVSLAYDGVAFDSFLQGLHSSTEQNELRFPYPPNLFLLIWPLGFLPFVLAWPAFLLPGMAGFFYIARRFTDGVTAAGMTLALGGPIHSLQLGQNGYYTAALLAGGLLAARRSSLLSGVCLGILAIKPHLAVVGFLALLFWREWKALGWAIGTVVAMSLLATVIYGPGVWFAFIEGNTSFAGELATTRRTTLVENFHQTFFAISVGAIGSTAAFILHGIVGLGALFVCAQIRSRHLAIAGVLATTLLLPPYSFVYDSTMLVLACAILIHEDRDLSWGLALLIGLTGLWFVTLTALVPFVAIAILFLIWQKDRAKLSAGNFGMLNARTS